MDEQRRRSVDREIAAPAPLRWALESLWAQLEPMRPGLTVELLHETDSTNTRLLERARTGDSTPCLLVAERQTAGRGRLGRPWFSDAPAVGSGPPALTFSLGLPYAPVDWSGLSLAIGVALAEALHPDVRLKWPNDLWLGEDARGHGRKLGGVLVETLGGADGQPRHAVIGIGLNLDAPAPRPGLDGETAGWHELDPQARAPDVLARVAGPLLSALATFESLGFTAFATRYAARDGLTGRTLQLSGPDPARGVADGVEPDGTLRLRGADGRVRLVRSGEVSVRPC